MIHFDRPQSAIRGGLDLIHPAVTLRHADGHRIRRYDQRGVSETASWNDSCPCQTGRALDRLHVLPLNVDPAVIEEIHAHGVARPGILLPAPIEIIRRRLIKQGPVQGNRPASLNADAPAEVAGFRRFPRHKCRLHRRWGDQSDEKEADDWGIQHGAVLYAAPFQRMETSGNNP